jgi:Myb-like DNA-binding domain.
MDNNLDKIVQKILLDLARIEKLKSEPRAVEPKVKKENNTEEAHKPDGKEGQKQAQNQEEHKNDGEWTQELQTKLEKAIVKYKDIKDPKEKWQKIAEEVPGKTMNDCVQRFKECRRIAEEKKQAELAKEAQRKQSSSGKSSSEEEDESEERSGEESGSDEFDVDDETDSEEEAKGTDRRKQVDMYEDEGCLLSMVVAKSKRVFSFLIRARFKT